MLEFTAASDLNGSSSRPTSTLLMPANTTSSTSNSSPKKASTCQTKVHSNAGGTGEVGALLRELLEGGGLQEPLIFKGLHSSWSPVTWTLAEWDEALKKNQNKFLSCRLGKKKTSNACPEWEWMSRDAELSWKQLIEWTSEDWWAVYDYKHLPHVLLPPRITEFDWSAVGYGERGGEKSSLWIGTQGAMTPCHFDTYGANFVTQVRGHKEWTLFPPKDTPYLDLTRVPYEESSVYSSINFNSPSQAQLESLRKCNGLRVVLEPGDVLFVPPKWWHSVSAVDFSISINTWIEIPEDARCRLEEAVICSLVASILSITEPDTALGIINRGQEDLEDIGEAEITDTLQSATRELCCSANPNPKPNVPSCHKLADLFALSSSIHKLEPYVFQSPKPEIPVFSNDPTEQEPNYIHALINAVGHPDVLKLITDKFLANVQSSPRLPCTSESDSSPRL